MQSKHLLLLFFLSVTILSAPVSTSIPNFLTFNLNSTNSRTILQPFLAQNPIINTQLNNITSLDMNTSFVSLFTYILSNSTIYNQLLPNISTIVPFAWTSTMTQIEKQTLLQSILTNSLPVFYVMMMNGHYLKN